MLNNPKIIEQMIEDSKATKLSINAVSKIFSFLCFND